MASKLLLGSKLDKDFKPFPSGQLNPYLHVTNGARLRVILESQGEEHLYFYLHSLLEPDEDGEFLEWIVKIEMMPVVRKAVKDGD